MEVLLRRRGRRVCCGGTALRSQGPAALGPLVADEPDAHPDRDFQHPGAQGLRPGTGYPEVIHGHCCTPGQHQPRDQGSPVRLSSHAGQDRTAVRTRQGRVGSADRDARLTGVPGPVGPADTPVMRWWRGRGPATRTCVELLQVDEDERTMLLAAALDGAWRGYWRGWRADLYPG